MSKNYLNLKKNTIMKMKLKPMQRKDMPSEEWAKRAVFLMKSKYPKTIKKLENE